MKSWYHSLSQRERLLVTYGSIAVALILLWLLAVKPLYNKHSRLNNAIEQQQQKLSTMKKQRVEIKQLQQQSSSKPKTTNSSQNPQQLIEKSLQTWRLKNSLERMQSQGNGVRLILKNANADRMMRFLYELENKHALTIANLAVTTAKRDAGLADFRMTIQKTNN